MFQHKRNTQSKSSTAVLIVLFLASLLIPSQLLAAVLPSPTLSASVQAGPQVSLSWAQPKAVISGFQLQRSLDPAAGFATIKTVSKSVLSATDTAVQAGTGYYYRVRSYKTGSTTSYSAFSNVVFADVPPAVAAVDSTPPSVSITSPSSGTSYTSAQTVSITASAQDNVGVSKVEFYQGGVLKKTATVSPYKHDWAVTAADNGSHSFTAKAYDARGNVASSTAISIHVNIPPPQPGSFEFSLSNYSVSEGAGKVDITIKRIGGSDGIATVDWRTSGVTATFDQDYASFTWTTLTFASGETSKTLGINIINDSLIEGDETFSVSLRNPTGGAGLGSITTSSVRIIDNDSDATPPTVSIASPVSGASYSSAQTITITASAQDNVGVSKVEFYAGTLLKYTDSAAPYAYAWAISAEDNGTHNFVAKAYDAAGNVAGSAVVNVSVNIVTQKPGRFEFAVSTYSVNEGSGKVNITINRVDGSDGTATVDWKTQGVSAAPSQDYGNFDWTTLVFASGETSKVQSVNIVNDTNVEGDESFNVLLGNPTGGATLGSITTSTVIIVDNDQVQSVGVYYGYNKSIGAADNPAAAPYGGVARYVSPVNGANTGNGSMSQPWATLEYAMKNCTAGDTIYLRGGIHPYSVTINNNVPATQTKPVEVRSYPGEWAIIDGSNTVNGNLFRLYNESWIILRNFEIRYSDTSRISAGLALEGSKDCQFHNLYIHGNHGPGVAGSIGTERLKFYNVTSENNYDVSASGENADGFAFTSGLNHEFYRCVSGNNSDDGWDLWASSGHYFEDCISHSNGYGTAGDGNGFKLGKVSASTPEAGVGGGKHKLVRCRAVGNKTRGFDENGSTVANSFEECMAYNSGQNWKLPNSAHAVSRGVSFGGTGDSIGSSCVVTDSKGQGFGSVVSVADFESVSLADMNNTTIGKRFFVPVSLSFWP